MPLTIHFREPPQPEDWPHIHFEGIRKTLSPDGSEQHVIAEHTGYVMHFTGHGETIEDTRKAAYRRIEHIVIPRMYFRADIGASVARNFTLLTSWTT